MKKITIEFEVEQLSAITVIFKMFFETCRIIGVMPPDEYRQVAVEVVDLILHAVEADVKLDGQKVMNKAMNDE